MKMLRRSLLILMLGILKLSRNLCASIRLRCSKSNSKSRSAARAFLWLKR